MRPGATKIESNGSLWWFDEIAHEYLRLPKSEGPRERPEWSDERAGHLQDAVWHRYERFTVDDQALRIYFEGVPWPASAPRHNVVSATVL